MSREMHEARMTARGGISYNHIITNARFAFLPLRKRHLYVKYEHHQKQAQKYVAITGEMQRRLL